MQDFVVAIRHDWATTLPYLVLYLATTGLDIICGFCVAYKGKRLSSSISRTGMMRKMIMVGTVLLAAMFDGMLPTIQLSVMGMGLELTFGALGCVWWLIHEMLSIVEHAAILGLPLPQRLKDALAVVRDSLDKPDDHDAVPPIPGKDAD